MKKMFITTVIGPVTPGIIKSLAQTTRGAGGEWLTSKVIKLDGQFSAMMKVAIEADLAPKLKSELEAEFSALQFFYNAVTADKHEPATIMHVSVDCSDRPGLTRDIVDILSNLDLAIENMEFNRVHVSSIGQTVFSSTLAIAVPDGVSSDSVVELLEGLTSDARVSTL